MAMNNINDVEKWDAFCRRLLQKTAAGEIQWEDWQSHLSRADSKSGLFVAAYKDWKILIYKYDYKYFHDEDEFTWTEDVAIELIDEQGNTNGRFRRSRHVTVCST
jgi:hypothetical protein